MKFVYILFGLLILSALYSVRWPIWNGFVHVVTFSYLDYLPSIEVHAPKKNLFYDLF